MWTRGALLRRIVWIDARTSLPGVGLVALYLWALLELPAPEWQTLLRVIGFWTLLLFSVSQILVFRRCGALARWIELRRGGNVSPDDSARAFADVVDLPRQLLRIGYPTWLTGGVAVWLHAERVCPRFEPFHGLAVLAACLSAGLFSMLFAGFLAKRELGVLREVLARQVGDVELREAALHPISLSAKLGVIAAGTALVPAVFAGFLMQARAGRPVEELVTRLQHQRLAAWPNGAPEPGAEPALGEDPLGQVFVVDEKREGEARPTLEPDEWRWILESPGERGDSRGIRSSHIFAWRRLPDSGRVLIAATGSEPVSQELGRLRNAFVAIVAAAAGFAFLLARLAARDLHQTSSALRAEARRIADGDLRPGAPFDSEDELGALGRSFERMARALREAVERVAEAAERVEQAAFSMEGLGRQVEEASVAQERGLGASSEALAEIDGNARAIHESVRNLAAGVEDSSATVHQLAASSGALRETAGVLTQRSEEMSGSLGEMLESVRRVEAHTESLAEAAAETSSSMHEMAGTSGEVERSAEQAEELARRSIALAEQGLERVQAAMRGMESIRAATDSAREVIHGLAQRTREIGAIVDVINEVADETSLLALNAAIIAAQAGEQGRAFSVVADSIKRLARRVLESTGEIEARVRSLQGESASAAAAIERGAESVASGVQLSADAGHSLEEITRSSRQSGERMQAILTAIREQAKATVHVAELMEHVSTGVSEIRAAIGQHARGSEGIRSSSTLLHEAARQVHRTAQEQASGSERMRAAVAAVLEEVERIGRALREQSGACQTTRVSVDRIHAETRRNQDTVRAMTDATRQLRSHAEKLRADVSRFRF